MEFRLSTTRRILITAGNAILSSVMIFILFKILDSDASLVFKYLAFLFFSAVTCVLLFSIVDAFYKKLILREELLMFKTLVRIDIIYWKDIAGYRLTESGEPILVHREPDRDAIKIPKGWENESDFFPHLLGRLTNLNQVDPQSNEVVLPKELSMENKSPEEKAKIDTAQQLAKLFSWITYLLLFWVIIYPKPYEVIIPLLVGLPIGVIVLAVLFEDLVRVYPDKNSPYPNLSNALILPSFALVSRAMLDFEILHYYDGVWIILGVIAVSIAVMLLWVVREVDLKRWVDGLQKIAATTFFSFLYVFGLYLMVNCHYDRTPKQDYPVAVVRKYFIEKKGVKYYVEVEPWGPIQETSTIEIPVEQYRKLNAGDRVIIQLSQGQLKTSWYKLKIL